VGSRSRPLPLPVEPGDPVLDALVGHPELAGDLRPGVAALDMEQDRLESELRRIGLPLSDLRSGLLHPRFALATSPFGGDFIFP